MTDIFTWFKFVFAFICGGLAYIFGGLDALLEILIIMMAIDYITGVCCNLQKRTLQQNRI